uniref:Uncharacterized protein n=1 Tax=Nelumbo nucifera TaxID=4432 RepID=A0A822YIY9_NELNU|nr:TPA_asm: hypothetical protein HUJ06_010322 [Nelumbo nucifera]
MVWWNSAWKLVFSIYMLVLDLIVVFYLMSFLYLFIIAVPFGRWVLVIFLWFSITKCFSGSFTLMYLGNDWDPLYFGGFGT